MPNDPACPVCGSLSFYVKDSQDEFETYGFTLADGRAVCDDSASCGIVAGAAESYCSRCSWHGRIAEVNLG